MTEDKRREAYLWDPSAAPSDDVQAIEKSLKAARFDVNRRPLPLDERPARAQWFLRPVFALAVSAVVIVAATSVFLWWRSSWPSGSPWRADISRSSGQTAVRTQLRLEEPMHLDGAASAQVEIARIGTMSVRPGSSLTLVESTSRRHRVALDVGTVTVRVWAPPGRFAFNTPAGTVLDMGCIFDLSVEPDGTSRVAVKTGWVQLENGWGEVLVPAGASSVMTPAARPGVPIYDDARAPFNKSIREFEQASDDGTRATWLEGIREHARRRDVLTLLLLSRHAPPTLKRPLLERAAELFPPPTADTIDGILAGDLDRLWAWKNTLGLPPVKSWWRNWRDALPLQSALRDAG